ncbi:MAG: hypothetical protein B6D64_02070 [Bacteroidetes bacterium 4484_276]|nr:MAG: hypothetical protein B6D64_02070 [Bacteroidetes bacterium 4484_276]
MFYLNQTEVKHLNKIRGAVADGLFFDKLVKVCDKTKPYIRDKGFVYTYAGCLLASGDKVDGAMKMFSLNMQDTFCSIMYGYLADVGVFEPAGKVFQSADAYDIYVQTNFYKNHQAGTLKNISKFAENIPPPRSDVPVTILDVGVGNGVLLAKIVNEIAPLYNIKVMRLIFIDPFEDMLKKAVGHCKQNINIKTEITTICCKVQDISESQINLIQQMKPIWFVNAALSVHHMPREAKVPMLKQLKWLSPNLLLTEVNWNHDLPEKGSPELIYSVANNYANFCKDILYLPVTEKEKKLCLYHFPLAEAINIIKQERASRIDYHTPIEEWKKIGREAGYSIGETTPTITLDNEAFAFVMELLGE